MVYQTEQYSVTLSDP